MATSQLPVVGVPEPEPTFVEEFSGTTVLWRAGGVFWNAAGWVNVLAHSFTIDAVMWSPPRTAP